MSTAEEIQKAIEDLLEAEYLQLERWWKDYQERVRDAKLARDSKPGGRLDAFLREVDPDIDS